MLIRVNYEDLNLMHEINYHEADGTEVLYSGILIDNGNNITAFFPESTKQKEVGVEIGEAIDYDEELLDRCDPEKPDYAVFDLNIESILCLYHAGLLLIDKAGVVSLRFGSSKANNVYRLGEIVDFDLRMIAEMISDYYLEVMTLERAS